MNLLRYQEPSQLEQYVLGYQRVGRVLRQQPILSLDCKLSAKQQKVADACNTLLRVSWRMAQQLEALPLTEDTEGIALRLVLHVRRIIERLNSLNRLLFTLFSLFLPETATLEPRWLECARTPPTPRDQYPYLSLRAPPVCVSCA